MAPIPVKITRPKPFLLQIEWSDGYMGVISLETLRRKCPCATCTGEQIGNMVYSKPYEVRIEPGVFDLKEMKPIGNYALSTKWGNGHSTGIYTYDLLREIFQDNMIKPEEIEELEKKAAKESKKIQLNVMKN